MLLVTNVAVGMVPFLFESTLVLLALLALGDRELHRALAARFPDPDRVGEADTTGPKHRW